MAETSAFYPDVETHLANEWIPYEDDRQQQRTVPDARLHPVPDATEVKPEGGSVREL